MTGSITAAFFISPLMNSSEEIPGPTLHYFAAEVKNHHPFISFINKLCTQNVVR
jgi:hypothetical protein